MKELFGLGMLTALFAAGSGAGGHAQMTGAFAGSPAGGNAPGEALPTGALSLAAAIDIALINNPGLGEIQQRVRAAEAVPSQEGSLPDPVL
ncbi:MAG TPA: hypothetical protein VD713_01830, partial [Sphingomonadales bacterium]|nr:hypothetical protein [Sphingomonadales bacterium]